MAKKQYGTRVVIDGLDNLRQLGDHVHKDIEAAELKVFHTMEPIMVKEVKKRIPTAWLLNKSVMSKRTFKGKRKNVRVSFKKIMIPKKQRTAEQLGRWQDSRGKWQKKKSSQKKNSPGRYWIFHDVGTPKNKEKGFSKTKALRFLKRAKRKVMPEAQKNYQAEIQKALAKYR